MDETSSPRDRLAELYVGYTDSVSRVITAEDVAAFAKLSGDYNALHMDDEFAARTEFEQRVVHGFLHASLLSTLVGMKIPGRGALYLSQSIDFTKAVFIGDTVEARGTIDSIDKASRIIGIRTEIVNQRGESVLRGTATVKVLRIGGAEAPATATKVTAMGDMLAGKAALVTGASRGIGRAIARTLAAHGAHVWINYYRSESAASELAEEIKSAGGACGLVCANVTDSGEVARVVGEITQDGGLDILVNNAGPKITAGPFDKLAWDDMSAAYDGIVGSTFRVTGACLPALKEAKGRIVNIVTSAALGRTSHNWLPYVAAKSALIAMSKNLAQELGPAGVSVNMVSPSMVDTDLVAGVPDKIRQMAVARTPLRRMATADDVAGAVLMLVSPYASFITGENLLVTGGDVMV
ncbi:MAG: SDR family oxidoreductase [Alphaproteobacteria bacterium]